MVEIIRTNERYKDGKNEVFVQAQYLNEEFGMIGYAKWLTPKEVAQYQENKTEETLETIMSKYENNAIYNKQMEALTIQSQTLSE